MKKYRFSIYICHLALLTGVSAGWWGIMYPQFGFSEDTFAIVSETEEKINDAEAFWTVLGAEPGELKIKSKLLEAVFDIRGNENEQQCTHRDF